MRGVSRPTGAGLPRRRHKAKAQAIVAKAISIAFHNLATSAISPSVPSASPVSTGGRTGAVFAETSLVKRSAAV